MNLYIYTQFQFNDCNEKKNYIYKIKKACNFVCKLKYDT